MNQVLIAGELLEADVELHDPEVRGRRVGIEGEKRYGDPIVVGTVDA